MNDYYSVKLRKYEDILRITGVAVLIFGVWTFVKVVFLMYFKFDYFLMLIDQTEVETPHQKLVTISIIVLILDIFIRLFIQRQALKEAKGAKKGYLYIILTALILLDSATSFLSYIDFRNNGFDDAFDVITSIMIEFTSVIITIELLFASLSVKWYRRKLQKGTS